MLTDGTQHKYIKKNNKGTGGGRVALLKSGSKRRSEGNMRVNEDKQMRCYVTCKCRRFKECKNVGRNLFVYR